MIHDKDTFEDRNIGGGFGTPESKPSGWGWFVVGVLLGVFVVIVVRSLIGGGQ